MKIRGVLAGLGVMILAGCSGQAVTQASISAAPETFDFKGTLLLVLADDRATVEAAGFDQGDGCSGKGGFSDLKEGAQVVIYDKSNVIIGTGGLDQGEILGKACSFNFTVPGIPTGQGIYQYQVTHRGKLVATEDQAAVGVVASLDNS